jgi:SnoaL-like protein
VFSRRASGPRTHRASGGQWRLSGSARPRPVLRGQGHLWNFGTYDPQGCRLTTDPGGVIKAGEEEERCVSVEFEIQRTISRFANSFDLKDWELMKSVLSDTVIVDYSDLRGEPAKEVDSDTYVQSRKDALANLHTHHLVGNFEIEFSQNSATVRASSTIFRRSEDRVFHTHAIYEFGLIKTLGAGWLIDSIKQSVLWNDGDSMVHKAAIDTAHRSFNRAPDNPGQVQG